MINIPTNRFWVHGLKAACTKCNSFMSLARYPNGDFDFYCWKCKKLRKRYRLKKESIDN